MKRFLLLVKFSLICFFLLISFKDGFAVIRYVKTGSVGTAPYTSWATASNDLQAVINAASAGDEIWIAEGKRIFQQPVQHSGSNDFKKLNIRQVKASGRYTLEISLESKTLKTIPVIIQ